MAAMPINQAELTNMSVIPTMSAADEGGTSTVSIDGKCDMTSLKSDVEDSQWGTTLTNNYQQQFQHQHLDSVLTAGT